MVIPKTNILAEFPVAWVDKKCAGQRHGKAAKAYLNWLYSPQAQTIITDYYYRVNNPGSHGQPKDKFRRPSCSAWKTNLAPSPEVMKTHFTSGGELDKLLAAGVGNVCRFQDACCRALPLSPAPVCCLWPDFVAAAPRWDATGPDELGAVLEVITNPGRWSQPIK